MNHGCTRNRGEASTSGYGTCAGTGVMRKEEIDVRFYLHVLPEYSDLVLYGGREKGGRKGKGEKASPS